MDYELAKELQDAGYPLRRIEPGMCVGLWPTLDMNPEGKQELGAQHFYTPTLSELIEACGESFYGVHRMVDDEWVAFMYDIEDPTRQVEGRGDTPEIAVAKLYLALK